MARISFMNLRKNKHQQQPQQHLASLSILTVIAIALSLTNYCLTPSDPLTIPKSLTTDQQPHKPSNFVNGSSPFPLGSTSTPPISINVSSLGSGSSITSLLAQSQLLYLAPELYHEPKDANLGDGLELVRVTSEISGAHKVQILEPRLSRQVQLRSKVDNGGCDLYNGRWVKDKEGTYPLYSPGQCPFVDQSFACQENGRRDVEYLKWRWKPHGCDLPRFNATNFLERLRGKVLMLVGDSMSRNQFESLLCLLRKALPIKSRMHEKRGYRISRERGYFTVRFKDYNCSVKYHRSYFLVSRGAHVDVRNKTRRTLQLDRIDKFALRWMTADILVFNTGDWWNSAKTNSGKHFFQEGDTLYPKFNPYKAYRRALRTWATWIEKNLVPEKNTVFYRGLGTAHFRGGAWYSGGICNKEMEPASKGRILDEYPWKMKITEEVIRSMRFPVAFLNVTKLTNFRKDAHPSIYGSVPTASLPGSVRREDCSHWCLPGVPDTWNELLYANLVMGR